MLNRIILQGVIKSLEVTSNINAKEVVNIVIDVPRIKLSAVKNKESDKFYCVAWNRVALSIAKKCEVGMQISIEGRVEEGKFKSNEGIEYSHKVVIEVAHLNKHYDVLEEKWTR